MQIYLAPLQGLTDWIFRESYAEHIGKFDKTFTAFIRVQNGEFYRPSQCNDLLPEHNKFQKPVPQFLGNDSDSFQLFEKLCLEQAYPEVNINLGCPYPMVTGKRMGAGLLAYPDELNRFLDKIFTQTKLKISIKCRLGQENAAEFEPLISIFNDFPLEEIIIHPRIGKEQYKGEVDWDAFVRYLPELKHEICYNGDIRTKADVEKIQSIVPQIDRFMIGRGIIQNPFLIDEIRGLELSMNEKATKLRSFHTALIEYSKQKYSGDLHFLKRFEEFWSYHFDFFENGHKIFKQVKKSKNLTQYEAVVFKAIKELE